MILLPLTCCLPDFRGSMSTDDIERTICSYHWLVCVPKGSWNCAHLEATGPYMPKFTAFKDKALFEASKAYIYEKSLKIRKIKCLEYNTLKVIALDNV